MYAMQRHEITLQIKKVMKFKTHETIIKFLFQKWRRAPLQGYRRVTAEQLFRTDQEIFARAAELTRGGLQELGDGRFALDPVIPLVLAESRIAQMMCQMPMAAGGGGGGNGGGGGGQHDAGGGCRG